MILISHRGNMDGKKPLIENTPTYINNALTRGYEVEIDVWYEDGFYLGHDKPKYKIDISFLKKSKLWCHAKNHEALEKMIEGNIHCFWHQTDDMTLTSKGYIWAYPGKQSIKGSIAVLPEIHNDDISKCGGICSDHIEQYKK